MTTQNQTSTPIDIEELLQKTHHENEIIKRQALENLNKLLPSLAAQRAGELLEDPDYIVRKSAIDILKDQKNCEIHVNKVRPFLQDVHYVPRYGALAFMHKVAPDEVISHAENMLDDDFLVSSLAITIIAEQNNRKAHKTLLKYAGHDDARIRTHCLELLVQHGVLEAQPLLEKALSDPDEYAHLCASQMSVKTPSVRSETETEGNNQNQPVECEIALTFDNILKNINNRDPDFAITYALAKLKDNDHNIRFTAIQFLYAQNDRSHQDHVQQLLTDNHHSIRNIALKYTKEVSAANILSRVRNNVDDTLCVTLQAIAIIASKQDQKSCETLLKFMSHDDKIVKAKCLYLLAEFYPEEAQPFLEKALLSPDKYTRLCASNAIELQKTWNK